MKTLHLVLKRKWFEMIASGEKTEEYREIKQFYIKRLCPYRQAQNPTDEDGLTIDCYSADSFKFCELCINKMYDGREGFKEMFEGDFADDMVYDSVTFQLGYLKNAPRMTFEIDNITIGKGREEWGATSGKDYFIIKLGKRVDE